MPDFSQRLKERHEMSVEKIYREAEDAGISREDVHVQVYSDKHNGFPVFRVEIEMEGGTYINDIPNSATMGPGEFDRNVKRIVSGFTDVDTPLEHDDDEE